MADGSKVCVDCEKIVSDLNKDLKEALDRKLDEKDWSKREKDEFKLQILKIFEDTFELSLRENVIVKHEDKSLDGLIQQEMEPVNKGRAVEVNMMCAKSEDLLTSTIKKRRHYPKKIRECLQKRHEVEFCDLHKKPDNLDTSLVVKEGQLDATEYEDYLQKFRTASENLSLLSKTFSETKEKAKRLHTASETYLRMKGSDINQTLFSKRTITFDSLLETPTKDTAGDTLTESDNNVRTSVWVEGQGPCKKLRGVKRKKSPDAT